MLLFALILTTTLLTCGAQDSVEYYVTPTPPPNPNCPGFEVLCETLTFYANNSNSLLTNKNSISLIFLEGNHSTMDNFYARQNNFTIVTGNGKKENTIILSSFIYLEAITNLTVTNLTFNNCFTIFLRTSVPHTSNADIRLSMMMLLQELVFQNSNVII